VSALLDPPAARPGSTRDDPASWTGFPDPQRTPALYELVLTGFFLFVPVVALAYLVVDGIGKPFPWFAAILTAVLIVIFGHGVTIGFHRLFTHKSFVAKRPLKITLAVLGTMAFQGSVVGWVADHRRHHRWSDRPGDPHSPVYKERRPLEGLGGFWHAHVGWCFTIHRTSREHYAADLLADRDLVLVDQFFIPLALLTFAIPFALGWLWTGTLEGAWIAFLLAGFVRIGISLNATWCINSVCHLFGKQPFASRDGSTNFAPLAPLTMGEAWHNNHHAFPRSARHGLLPGQLDSSARIIRWMEQLGWVTDVQWPTPEQIAAKRIDGRQVADADDDVVAA
jgi:stearoyl-CoA desaturase (delta-9 desaturase)